MQSMIGTQEKEVGPRYSPPTRPGRESLRNGESQYGQQFSGVAQGDPVSINSSLVGQLFFGSEIALLEPISYRSIINDEQATEVTLNWQEISEVKVAADVSEFKYAEKIEKVSPQKTQDECEHSLVIEQIQMQSAHSIPSYQMGEEFLSQLSFVNTNESPRDIGKKNEDILPDRLVLVPAIPSSSSQLIKPSPSTSTSTLTADTENQKVLFSEPVSASSVKYLPFGYSKSDSFVVIKNVDKDLGDTLMSDSLSRLDARNFSQVELIVYNGKNNATLIGNALDNTLIGSGGNDRLTGGGGNDQLIGGGGNDVFVFGANDGRDQIIDFSFGDKIQFRGAAFLNQLEISDSAAGQQVQFGATIVEIVGFSGLDISTDWVLLSR